MLIDHSDGTKRFFQIHLGGDRNFCYLMGDPVTGEAAAVDPGFEPDRFHDLARENRLKIKYVLITHGHGDHVDGAARLVELTGAQLFAGEQDQVPGAQPLTDGQSLSLGDLTVQTIHTPGHSPGHFCYLFDNHLVTGDLLFCGKVGGTGSYFAGSSARQEYASLQKILKLPGTTGVFPGHDYYGGEGKMPHSTLAYELANNPFISGGSYEAFCHLKDNWADYKKEHGIR